MKPEAYIALEDTMVSILRSSWLEDASALRHGLQALLEENLITQAYQLVNNTTMEGSLDKVKEGIRELGVSALLFGASTFGPPEQTSFFKTRKIPDVLDSQISLLTNAIEQKGWQAIKKNALGVIQQHEEDLRDAAYVVRKMDVEELSEALNKAVLEPTKALYAFGANVTTSRLVSYGFLAEATATGVTTYQVTEVLDGVTCGVCGYMHGKTFQVAYEMARLEQVMRITDPDELKHAAPFPKNSKEALQELYSLSAEQLQNRGWGSPPYHPLCRGLLTITGTILETINPQPIISNKPPENSNSGETIDISELTEKISRAPINSDELQAVKDYLTGGFAETNALLRNPASGLGLAELILIQQRINRLDSAISRGQITGPLEVYRGVYNTKSLFGVTDPEKMVGKELIERAYLSVGSLETAIQWAGEEGAIMKIKLGLGVKALVPSDYPDLPAMSQMDVLLQRGLKLTVTEAYMQGTQVYMVLTATIV